MDAAWDRAVDICFDVGWCGHPVVAWSPVFFGLFMAVATTSDWWSRSERGPVLATGLLVQAGALLFAAGLLARLVWEPTLLLDWHVTVAAALAIPQLVLGSRHCHYLTRCIAWRRRGRPVDAPGLLPSQDRLVKHLRGLFERDGLLDSSTPLVSLRGKWGLGKSTIIRSFCDGYDESAWARIEARRDEAGTEPWWARLKEAVGRALKVGSRTARPPAARTPVAKVPIIIEFNAWRHQSDSSLDASLFTEIAGEVLCQLRTLWWLRPVVYPWFLTVVPRLSLNLPGLGQSSGQMDVRMRSPGVELHPHLRRLAQAVEARDARIVVVIDEIDRCEPAVAQAVLVLIQRFLHVGGIRVVVPYVERQLRFKVFHPAVLGLPELRVSGAAELQNNSKIAVGNLKGQVQDLAIKIWLEGSKTYYSTSADTAGFGNRTAPGYYIHRDMHPLQHAITLQNFNDLHDRQEQYFNDMERRFVTTVVIDLQPPSSEDFAHLICNTLWIRNECVMLAEQLGLAFPPGQSLAEYVTARVKHAYSDDPDQASEVDGATGRGSYLWERCRAAWRDAAPFDQDYRGEPVALRPLVAFLRQGFTESRRNLDSFPERMIGAMPPGAPQAGTGDFLFVLILEFTLQLALDRLTHAGPPEGRSS